MSIKRGLNSRAASQLVYTFINCDISYILKHQKRKREKDEQQKRTFLSNGKVNGFSQVFLMISEKKAKNRKYF